MIRRVKWVPYKINYRDLPVSPWADGLRKIALTGSDVSRRKWAIKEKSCLLQNGTLPAMSLEHLLQFKMPILLMNNWRDSGKYSRSWWKLFKCSIPQRIDQDGT